MHLCVYMFYISWQYEVFHRLLDAVSMSASKSKREKLIEREKSHTNRHANYLKK